jgi:hypothetical protein
MNHGIILHDVLMICDVLSVDDPLARMEAGWSQDWVLDNLNISFVAFFVAGGILLNERLAEKDRSIERES